MSENPLIKKLLLKPGQRILILNAPEGYLEKLQPLPEGVAQSTEPSAEGNYDLVLSFFKNKAEVDSLAPTAITAVKSGGLLWLCYPKRSGKVITDINRDSGWQTVREAGWEGVSLIAIDEVWSAMRYRPLSEIKITPGSSRLTRQKEQNG